MYDRNIRQDCLRAVKILDRHSAGYEPDTRSTIAENVIGHNPKSKSDVRFWHVQYHDTYGAL